MTQTGNPIIRHLFTADPSVIEHNGTVYLYTGHDETPPGVQEYDMHDWRCFSSTDMDTWNEHPVPLRASNFAWALDRAFASQVVQRNGKFETASSTGTSPSDTAVFRRGPSASRWPIAPQGLSPMPVDRR